MSVSRTIDVKLTPTELATLFAEMDSQQQAWFFAVVWRLMKDQPGAAWCQQSYAINLAARGNQDAENAIETLASHLTFDTLSRLLGSAA